MGFRPNKLIGHTLLDEIPLLVATKTMAAKIIFDKKFKFIFMFIF